MIEVTERHLSEAYAAEMSLWLDPEGARALIAGSRGEAAPEPMNEEQMARWIAKVQQLTNAGTKDPQVISRARVMAAREAADHRGFKYLGGFEGIKLLSRMNQSISKHLDNERKRV